MATVNITVSIETADPNPVSQAVVQQVLVGIQDAANAIEGTLAYDVSAVIADGFDGNATPQS